MNIIKFLLFWMLLTFITGDAASSPFVYKARYTAEGCDAANFSLDLLMDGTFTLSFVLYEADNLEDGPVRTPDETEFHGHYTEGVNTFDLSFENASRDQIEDVFSYTKNGGFIRSTDIYRINKEPDLLYIAGCSAVKIL